MADPPAKAHLHGEPIVGVDAKGAIAIVVGLVGAPTPLWGEMLVGLDTRPAVVTRVGARAREGSPAAPPTQVEVRVDHPDHVRAALDWLVGAVASVNERYDAHQRRLAAIYREALTHVADWQATVQTHGVAGQHPT